MPLSRNNLHQGHGPATIRPAYKITPDDPRSWGPHLWITIHSIASGYSLEPTDVDKMMYRIYYENLPNVLPCKTCRDHFHKVLTKYPLEDSDLASRKSLTEWTLRIHNVVSKELEKPDRQCTWTYDMLTSIYDQASGVYSDEDSDLDNEPILESKTINVQSKITNVQRPTSRHVRNVNMHRQSGSVGPPQNSASRREFRQISRQVPRRTHTVAHTSGPSYNRAAVPAPKDITKKKSCGCGGRKRT